MLGENLFIKLWETLAKDGIGSLASPWQIKREGRAHLEVRRDEMLTMAQAELDAKEILQGRKKLLPDGSVISLTSPEEDVYDYLGRADPPITFRDYSSKSDQKQQARRVQQEINLNKAICLAEEEILRSNQEPPEGAVESDWVNRWQDHAKNTTNEELRRLWARALAGEVKSPGSYSLRTLEFIKNLSQEEALAISKLGAFAISGTIVKVPQLEKEGINFQFLLKMDELGLISGVQGGSVMGLNFSMESRSKDKYSNFLVNRNRILMFEAADVKKVFKTGCYPITQIGNELLALGDFSANEMYMRDVGLQIKSQGFDVRIAFWEQVKQGEGIYKFAEKL